MPIDEFNGQPVPPVEPQLEAVPEPLGLGRRLLYGLGQGLQGRDPSAGLAQIDQARIAAQARNDARLEKNDARLEKQRKKEDEDPNSASSAAARETFIKGTSRIAAALKVDPQVLTEYVGTRSKAQLQAERPHEVLLEIAKLNDARAKAREGGEDKEKVRVAKKIQDQAAFLNGEKRVGSTGPYQMAAKRYTLASDGLRIVDQVRSGQLIANPQIEAELATNLAAQLTGGSQPAQQTIHDFMARTGQKDVGSVVQYLKSKPQDTLSKSFLAQFEHQLSGQREFWREQGLAHIDRANKSLRKDFDKYPDLAQEYEARTSTLFGGGGSAQDGQSAEALQWANANPQDPRAAAIKAKLGVK